MLALRLPLRLAARAAPSNAPLATPIVASSLSTSRSYRTKAKADASTVPQKLDPIGKKAAKEAAAKKARKPKTPEEKAAISAKAKAAQLKEQIKMLKAQALSPPKNRPLNAWTIYVRENAKEKAQGAAVSTITKQLAEDYKTISTREREHYNHLVTEANAKSLREFEEWLNARTPAQILAANYARAQLRSKLTDAKVNYYPIKDDRLVRQPRNSFIIFHSERISSGDLRGIKAGDAVKATAAEFKALSASERKKYEDLAVKDQERYAREYQEVYGVEKPDSGSKPRPTPST